MIPANDDADALAEQRMALCQGLVVRGMVPMDEAELEAWKFDAASILATWAQQDGFAVVDIFEGRCPPGSEHAAVLDAIMRAVMLCHGPDGKRLIGDGVAEFLKMVHYGGQDVGRRAARALFEKEIGQSAATDFFLEIMMAHFEPALMQELRDRAQALGIDPDAE